MVKYQKQKGIKMSKQVSCLQCSGCVSGSSTEDGCYKPKNENDISCNSHVAGTHLMGQGKILLGMPKGFNRKGPWDTMPLSIFPTKEAFMKEWGPYNKLNLPVWKYKDSEGQVFVRGLSPRRNAPFLHVFLESSIFDEINCAEITEEDLEGMD
jgi:hypothetical protein